MSADETRAVLGSLPDDLRDRLRFLLEADALKRVVRRSPIVGGSRLENTAEHSWHLALMALVLAPTSDEPIDVGRVVAMCLVHDLVEIDAGDAFLYDETARAAKAVEEQRAADRLFALYGDGSALRELWEEFEAAATPEARFARAVDRLEPLMLNHANEGAPWRTHGITSQQVLTANGPVADGSGALWDAARALIDDAIARGWLP